MAILKNTAFGCNNSKDLFTEVITPQFNALSTAQDSDIIKYYSFIFSAGSLRDWIKNEFNLSGFEFTNSFLADKDFSIFHSIYNNSKHFKLTSAKEYYVTLDAKSQLQADDCSGDHGSCSFFCTVKEASTGQEEEIFLYEICKRVYHKYQVILGRYIAM